MAGKRFLFFISFDFNLMKLTGCRGKNGSGFLGKMGDGLDYFGRGLEFGIGPQQVCFSWVLVLIKDK